MEKAIPVLNLYERAEPLAGRKTIVVCADEKPSIQARKLSGGLDPASRGQGLRRSARYQRKGAIQLFAAWLVHTGETLARCFDRKRFVDFQAFLQMLFGSLWHRDIRVVHLVLDNGTTHAPKQRKRWIKSLRLPFKVRVHWLPVNASWLDQLELILSSIQKKVLTPNDFENKHRLIDTLMAHFAERNRDPQPVQWSYTATKLRNEFPRWAKAA